ncbi:MAG: hypothetical protein K8J08_21210 [Thermoanaerobaculia bacterium]|nr:hypothetical protein [Thermoanaerobaculia bacterium]
MSERADDLTDGRADRRADPASTTTGMATDASASLRWSLAPLLALATLAATFKIRSYDTFWHLAAGHWILDHRRLPNPDPLRFTAEGHRWVDHEWLFQVGLAWLERMGGLSALSVLRILAVVGLAWVLWIACRRLGASRISTALIAGAAVWIARPRFFLRPELLTLVLLSVFLLLLLEVRRRPSAASILPLIGLVVLWANAHPAVLMAPVVAAALLVGSRWEGAGNLRHDSLTWWIALGLPVGIAAATLLNPAGLRLWLVPTEIAKALEDIPGINPEWLPMWKQPQVGYLIALVVLVLATILTRRRTGRTDLGTGLVALALAVLASTSVRHLAPFVVGAALHIASCIALLGSSEGPQSAHSIRHPWRRWLPWTLASLAILYCLAPPTTGPLRPRQGVYHFGLGLESNRFPVQAVDFVEAHPEIGNLYNNVAYGGYMLWRLYPPRRIFNDGRNELNPTFLAELANARRGAEGWDALFDRYQLEGALVRYDPRRRPVLDAPVPPATEPTVSWMTSNEALFSRDRFALVHWDDVAMVLLLRTPSNRALIESYEYRFVRPEDPEGLALDAQNPQRRRSILREIQRKLLEDPESQRARLLMRQLQGETILETVPSGTPGPRPR